MSHETLANYLETNFAVMHHHSWDPEWFESITSFERQVYVGMLKAYLNDEKDRQRLMALQKSRM